MAQNKKGCLCSVLYTSIGKLFIFTFHIIIIIYNFFHIKKLT